MKKLLFVFALIAFLQLSAQTGTVVIGINDGTPNGAFEYPCPLQDYYKTGRAQFCIQLQNYLQLDWLQEILQK